MGKKPKTPTKPLRVHVDVANLAERLAPLFGESVPDFVSNRLRPMLQELIPQAAERLMDEVPKKKPSKRD